MGCIYIAFLTGLMSSTSFSLKDSFLMQILSNFSIVRLVFILHWSTSFLGCVFVIPSVQLIHNIRPQHHISSSLNLFLPSVNSYRTLQWFSDKCFTSLLSFSKYFLYRFSVIITSNYTAWAQSPISALWSLDRNYFFLGQIRFRQPPG